MKGLPDTIYVQLSGSGDDTWLCAESTPLEAIHASLEGRESGEAVGVYRLERVVKLNVVEESLQPAGE